jgi:hypothetical protein
MSSMPKLHFETVLLSLLVALAGVGTARAVDGPLVRLTFVPQENVNAPVATISAALKGAPIAVAVEDGRAVRSRDVVGEVDREGIRANVRAENDVVVYALGALVQSAGQWGLPVVQGTAGTQGRGPGRVLTVRVTRFWVDENVKPVGSTYAAEVNALFRLSDGGRLVYEGVAAGTARRYGKSENEENYSEVLSDALKETYAKGLSDPGLQSAWTAGPRDTAPRPRLAPREAPGGERPADGVARPDGDRSRGVSPADLLADLKELQRQGFTADLLVDYVDQRTLTSEMTARDLTAWREAGIPDEVIKAALARSPAAPAAPR